MVMLIFDIFLEVESKFQSFLFPVTLLRGCAPFFFPSDEKDKEENALAGSPEAEDITALIQVKLKAVCGSCGFR